jgi:uncharacterized protein (TIGR00725 family)
MTGPAGLVGPGRRPPRVSVVGAGQASALEESLAHDLGRALGAAGAVVVTGGLGGVMEAASRGCIEGGGQTVGLLPGTDPGSANPWVTLPLATGLGEARNALVVRAGEVVVAVGGSWGTLSEIALARKMGRDVALLGHSRWSLPVTSLGSAAEAAAWALDVVARRRPAP